MESGTKLGHYEIGTLLGKGGMGEVWRARDTKLGREVAIKTLPEEFAKDADRLGRFEREAKLLASLNHPNIAAIHGFEEDNGTHFLVLELVEGDTLAGQLKRGAIPVEESLKLALQIAEALEAAHERGVIHRDLKPANIKVTSDGKVKVLDFGLAKAVAGDGTGLDISNSPTVSVVETRQGIILGTAAYMSPEQATGQAVNLKTDIWAFGCVLFEILTGQQVWAGRTVTDVIGDIVAREPNWKILPPNLHSRIGFLLERCLEKEGKDRLSGISDARVEIQKALADPSGVLVQPVAEAAQAGPQSRLLWVAGIVLGIIVAGMTVWNLRPQQPLSITRFSHVLPAGENFTNTAGPVVAVSPDGSRMVHVANEQLYVREMDALSSTSIPGTDESPRAPFFSPDGAWIGYWSGADPQLKKIALSGGAPVTLSGATPLGKVSWGADDTIVFGQLGGIMRLSGEGGEAELLIPRSGEGNLTSPQILPDGRSVVFQVGGQIAVQSLESGERKILFPGADPRYVPTGHLVYGLDDVLFAVPFSLDTLEVVGAPVAMVERIRSGPMQYALSDSGTLVFVPGTGDSGTLVWVDRRGNVEPLGAPLRDYGLFPRLSPDGQRVLVPLGGDIWLFDIARQTLTRLTFEGNAGMPIWTRDGQYATYRSIRQDSQNIFWIMADGSGTEERLTAEDFRQNPTSWSRDGQLLAFYQTPGVGGVGDRDIWIMPVDGDREPWPFLQTPFNEAAPRFAPDGRRVAYVSDESGRQEVYVQLFPGPGGRRQISAEGGGDPVWSRNGQELFYMNGNQMIAVDIETEPTFITGAPTLLFEGRFQQSTGGRIAPYDVTADGQRFLMIQDVANSDSEAEPAQINIVLNWFEELKERVPVP